MRQRRGVTAPWIICDKGKKEVNCTEGEIKETRDNKNKNKEKNKQRVSFQALGGHRGGTSFPKKHEFMFGGKGKSPNADKIASGAQSERRNGGPSAKWDKNAHGTASGLRNVGPSAKWDKIAHGTASGQHNVGPSAKQDKIAHGTASGLRNVGPSAKRDKIAPGTASGRRNIGPSAKDKGQLAPPSIDGRLVTGGDRQKLKQLKKRKRIS